MTSRANTLLLSGATINALDDNVSPSNIVAHSLTGIKDTYNFDLKKEDVQHCQRLRGKDNKPDRILLTLNNGFTKSDLMSSVIQKNKSQGVALNVNEYLSTYNGHLLYRLRQLRKTYNGKVFSSFSRNGRIFYKIRKNSRPILIKDDKDLDVMETQLQNHGFLMDRASGNVQQAHAQRPSTRNWRKQHMDRGENSNGQTQTQFQV